MNAREQAETRQREAEERMQRMLEDMERAKRELAEAHSTIHSLEAQLKQLQLVSKTFIFALSFNPITFCIKR